MMIPSELLSIIGRRHFIAEIRTETAKQALSAVEALARGGIMIFEISLAIPGAEEILRHFAQSTEIIVGAGSVLDTRQCAEAAAAGARFIASPIMVPELVTVCAEHHVTPILGALTPTEIIAAQRAGAELVKVTPVSALGGSMYIRSLFRQFTYLSIMVSGGINIENMAEYLALPVRAMALGSTLTPRALVDRGDWTTMTTNARRIVEYAAALEAASGAPSPYVTQPGRPSLPDTVMAPAPYISYPGVPPSPAISQPSPFIPAISQPPLPPAVESFPPLTPAPPENPSFRPWDSKPAKPGKGDDWIR